MDILLISTTDLRGGRNDVRDRMLKSLTESQRSLPGHSIKLFFLLQNCTPDELAVFLATAPEFVHAVAVAGRVPLSVARNRMLRPLMSDAAIGPDALVAFPDDDCWYPDGFLSQVVAAFARDMLLDFWFCRYASQPIQESFAAAEFAAARTGEIVRNASSNTMFMRGRIVTAVGDFDEALGVGTPLGGSEDIDYALRARRVARKTAYRDAALVGHRDKSPGVRARYYASSLLVLTRHACHGAAVEFFRKIAVGAVLTLRGELGIREFAGALRAAVAERLSR